MKKIILFTLALAFPIFLFSPLQAARTYTLKSFSVDFDSSLGTFTWNSRKVGYVTGGSYQIDIYDTVTQHTCTFSGNIILPTPLSSPPTKTQIMNRIESDAQSNGIKNWAIDCLAKKTTDASRSSQKTDNSWISAIEDSIINEVNIE